jgi:hypothetical protein
MLSFIRMPVVVNSCTGLRDTRQETVFHGLQRLQAELPFPITP